jgi:hypothetical protein
VYHGRASRLDAGAGQVLMPSADWAGLMTLTTRDDSSKAGADRDVYSDPSDICHRRSAVGLFSNSTMKFKERNRRRFLPASN